MVFTFHSLKFLKSCWRSLQKQSITLYWFIYSFSFLYIFLSCLWKVYLISCLSLSMECRNRIVLTRWLKQKFTFSQFGRLAVWDQDGSTVSFWYGFSSWLVNGPLLIASSCGGETVSKLSGVSSYEDANPVMKASLSWPNQP